MSAAVVLVVLAMTGAGSLLAWVSGGPGAHPADPGPPVRVLVLLLLVLDGIGSIGLAIGGQGGGPLLVGGAMLAIGIGSWIARRWRGRPQAIPSASSSGPVRWLAVGAGAAVGMLAIASIVVTAGLPLLASDPQASRAAFSGLTLDVFRWLVPTTALLVLAWALADPTPARVAIAAAGLGGVVAIEVLFASRALPFELALGAVLITWWAGRRPPVRAWLGLGIAAAILFFGVLFARMGPEASFSGPLDAMSFMVDRTVGRIVFIQARTVDVAVTAIPAQEPFWGGATYLHRLGPAIGIAAAHPSLGTWLYARLYPGSEPAFAAPGVLAEGWVNGGPLLALGLMLVLGFGAQLFGRATGRLGASPVDRAAAATVTVALARTYASSLNGFLLTVVVTAAWWLAARPGARFVAASAVSRLVRSARRG
jgi:hypothetical protein